MTPFIEVHLIQLNEAYISRVLTETLVAHIEAIFPDHIMLVLADAARMRILPEFSQTAPVQLLVTHLALLETKRQKPSLQHFLIKS